MRLGRTSAHNAFLLFDIQQVRTPKVDAQDTMLFCYHHQYQTVSYLQFHLTILQCGNEWALGTLLKQVNSIFILAVSLNQDNDLVHLNRIVSMFVMTVQSRIQGPPVHVQDYAILFPFFLYLRLLSLLDVATQVAMIVQILLNVVLKIVLAVKDLFGP